MPVSDSESMCSDPDHHPLLRRALAWVLFCVDTDPCFCYCGIQFLLLTTITPLPPLQRDQNAEKLFAQERLLRSPEAGMYECYRKFLKYEKTGKKNSLSGIRLHGRF